MDRYSKSFCEITKIILWSFEIKK